MSSPTDNWHIFLVGTSQYSNDVVRSLKYAASDAIRLKQRFMDLGVKESNITILTTDHDAKQHPDKEKIEIRYKEFIESLQEDSLALVFLSGHGLQLENVPYYLPRDYNPDKPRDRAVSIKEMFSMLEKSKASLKFMLVDACRDDAYSKAIDNSSFDPAHLVAQDVKAVALFQSCSENERSYEFSFQENTSRSEEGANGSGAFTEAILKGLTVCDNPADQDKDRCVTFFEFVEFVCNETTKLAKEQQNTKQTPCIEGSINNFNLLTNLTRDGISYDDQKRADQYYKTALELSQITVNGDSLIPSLMNARTQPDKATLEKALSQITLAIEIDSKNNDYLNLRNYINRALEDAEETIKEQKANDAYNQSVQLLKQKDFDGALEQIDQALSYAPDNQQYQAQKDKVCREKASYAEKNARDALDDNDFATARQQIEIACKLFPENQDYLDLKDKIHQAERDKEYESTTKSAGFRQIFKIAGVDVPFRWIPSGSFKMGSPQSDEDAPKQEKPQYSVTISRGFWMAETETTQELWKAVAGFNPSKYQDDNSLQFPVENVSWNDCDVFIRHLNSQGYAPTGWKFSLPTDAQWEYACRANSNTSFSFGNSLNGTEANCDGTEPYNTKQIGPNLGKTTKVASYKANSWGLFDMHGNVDEWALDYFEASFDAEGGISESRVYFYLSPNEQTSRTDPTGPSQGTWRVLRGGSWVDAASLCRSAYRRGANDQESFDSVGVRLVLIEDDAHAVNNSSKRPIERVWENNAKLTTEAKGKNAGDRKVLELAGVDVGFRWIPRGKFHLGACPEDILSEEWERTDINVTLSHGFWLAETETTQELYQAVMDENPSEYHDDPQNPVENLKWDDCMAFVDKLNSFGVLPYGWKFTLPTDAQWEYACRAGSRTAFSFGNYLDGSQANCDSSKSYGTSFAGSSLGHTTPVGSYEPNAWGLFDMHGNVYEYCLDLFDDVYDDEDSPVKDYFYQAKEDRVDPTGPKEGTQHVIRGGCWYLPAYACRSNFRIGITPAQFGPFVGLRLAIVETNPQTPDAPKDPVAPMDIITSPDHGSLRMTLIPIPSGKFTMGTRLKAKDFGEEWGFDDDDSFPFDDCPEREVEITKGFYLGRYPVTRKQFQSFVEDTRYTTTAESLGYSEGLKNDGNWGDMTDLSWKNPGFSQDDDHPVVCVSYKDVMAFINWLNEFNLCEGYHFTLPTEAQWEYACRAGTSTIFYWGDKIADGEGYLNGADLAGGPNGKGWKEAFPFSDYSQGTSPVGKFKPNAFGLSDMLGNVKEWLSDWYGGQYYVKGPHTDPQGPQYGVSRVVRGGGWHSPPSVANSIYRGLEFEDYSTSTLGFRVALVPNDVE